MNYCTYIPSSKIAKVQRIIVIGDIHGDWAALKSALKIARVIDHLNLWVGGRTHLVQVGDIIDRGSRGSTTSDERSESRILNHLIDLKKKAQRAGGDVHILLGNHEIMNVMGDFRYVSPLGHTDFGGNRARAFRPGGKVAKLLACNANAVVQIGSWVFSHAGVTSDISKKHTVEQVNSHVREYLLGNTALSKGHPIMDIFWHRRYGHEGTCPSVRKALTHWKARNMAVGHTVQPDGINSLCDRSLWRVDIGMSGAFGHRRRIEVLEILDDGKAVNILKN